MQSLQNILNTFINDYGLQGGIILHAIRRQWDKLVGATIACHTFPYTLKGKMLTLIVDTPQWLHHLSFFKNEITTKLNPFNVTEIRFKLGKLPENSEETRAPEDIKLSNDDLRYLENTLSNLKDDDLREKFRKLIIHGLIMGKK